MTVATPSPLNSGDCNFESLYGALRAQARRYLRTEYNAQSMSPTILVHEAWLSLARSRRLAVADASHYVRLVSRVMKNLLVDHARRKRAASHGGALQRIEWHDADVANAGNPEQTLAIAAALDKLALQSPRLATLVELRYFAGFSESEIARIMGVSTRSVRRQWRVARLRLLDVLQSPPRNGGNHHA